MRRRSTALLGGLAAFTLVAASAATFGGLTVGGLGAGSAAVTACTSEGIDADFTTGDYDVGADLFPVATVALAETTGEDLCADAEVTVVLLDGDPGEGDELLTITGTFGQTGGASFDIENERVDAEAVEGIAVSVVG